MKLSKMYAPVNIRFSSLRNDIINGGAMYDIDTIVERKCRRVLCKGGWKWQIVGFVANSLLLEGVEIDKEVLDNNESFLEFDYT